MIFKNLTFFIFKINQALDLKKQITNFNERINIIISHEMVLWQGNILTRLIQEKLSSDKINVFVDCSNKSGLVLSLIKVGIKNIIFYNCDIKIEKKIKQIANKNKSKIFKEENFINVLNSYENYNLKKNSNG